MSAILGVDGCRGGWLCVSFEPTVRETLVYCVAALEELPLSQYSVIAVDMPVGLPRVGYRTCDSAARSRLPAKAKASVFYAPVRSVLRCTSYKEALMVQRRSTESGFSIQAWNIVPKIREIDELCQRGRLGGSFYEVHPELSFREWSGMSVMPRKKSVEGIALRKQLISDFFGIECDVPRGLLRTLRPTIDDLCDAYAALWSALRIHTQQAIALPESPELDELGRRMQIFV